MQTGHNVLKLVIAVISAVIGGSIGGLGGPAGAITGVISGLLVGYYYVHFTLKLGSRNTLSRIFSGTVYGALAGLISGTSIYIPNILMHAGGGKSIGMLGLGGIFGIIVGAALGFIVACIIAFIPREKELVETNVHGSKPAREAEHGITLSPESAELIMAVYPALKEHNLFDRHTARAYQAKFGASGSPEELEGRYTQALAWLQAKRPGFTPEQWEKANADTHQLVRFIIARGAGSEAGLEESCPGLGEEFYGWIVKAARLFA